MDLRILSQKRYVPPSKQTPAGTEVPLSILDATVVTFSPTSAVWYYDASSEEFGKRSLSVEHLLSALEKTLASYPQLAGQLSWTRYNPKGNHALRYGRTKLSYGTSSDPGVEIVTAHCSSTLSTIVPTVAERVANSAGWCATNVPSAKFLPKTPLALHNLIDFEGLPCLIVQITSFDCGGVAIAIKIAHAVADAQAMVSYMRDWAKVCRASLLDEPLPQLDSVFDPTLLDKAAAGDIDAPTADASIIKKSRLLPVHRFDCWASADGAPDFLEPLTRIPTELENTEYEAFGKPLPWSEWDVSAQADYYLIFFKPTELSRMWTEASSLSPSRVSHLDALLAHIWILINRAKGLEMDKQSAYLDVTVGIRSRLSPPLPDSFFGSPILLTNVSIPGKDATTPDAIGKVAATIRSFISKFNSETLPALLHDVAYQESGQRYWCAFMGKRNTIVTSWLQQDVYSLDFGAKMPPRYVEAIMPNVDGCLHVMDAGFTNAASKGTDGTSTASSNQWYETGVSVSLHLNAVAMQKLLQDPLLRRYGSDK